MPKLDGKTVDTAALRKLYESAPFAKAAFDYFASRTNNAARTTVDRLMTRLNQSGQDVSRAQLIDFLKALGEARCGSFIIGRKGHPSRFRWSVNLIEVGQAAAGQSVKIESRAPAPQATIGDTDDGATLEHKYRLRADLEIGVKLPSDLTQAEANRLADFVRTLPFN